MLLSKILEQVYSYKGALTHSILPVSDSFIKKYLGSPTDIDVEKLKIEYEKLKDENIRLNKQVDDLQKEVNV